MDPDLAASLGVNRKALGMLVQTFSCTIAGGSGVLYGFIYKSFHLDFFTFALVGISMTIIFVGGYATLWGTVVAAPILYGVPLLFPPEVQSWRIVIYGALLILVLVLKPEGFITPAVRLYNRNLSFGEPKETEYLTQGGRMKKLISVLVIVLFATALGFGQAKVVARTNGRSPSSTA